jgi:hypothetical protein
MKWLIFSCLLCVLVRCGQSPASAILQAENLSQLTKDTLNINGQRIILTRGEQGPQYMVTIIGDTILAKANYYHSIDTIDINMDEYTDLRVFIFSNTPNQCENYLFDSSNKSFRLLQNCDLDITRLNDADLYYSYNGEGCSNLNWKSQLSRIEQFKLITIGYINCQGCDDNTANQKVDIFKVKSETCEKTLIKSLPYLTTIPKSDLKWGFIQTYWDKNWKQFTD